MSPSADPILTSRNRRADDVLEFAGIGTAGVRLYPMRPTSREAACITMHVRAPILASKTSRHRVARHHAAARSSATALVLERTLNFARLHSIRRLFRIHPDLVDPLSQMHERMSLRDDSGTTHHAVRGLSIHCLRYGRIGPWPNGNGSDKRQPTFRCADQRETDALRRGSGSGPTFAAQ